MAHCGRMDCQNLEVSLVLELIVCTEEGLKSGCSLAYKKPLFKVWQSWFQRTQWSVLSDSPFDQSGGFSDGALKTQAPSTELYY